MSNTKYPTHLNCCNFPLHLYRSKMWCMLIFCVAFLNAPAQKVSAILDREKMLLGEQVTLRLKVEDVNLVNTSCATWFELADTANHLEVVKRAPIDTIELNGLISYEQQISITSFDSGKWALPALQVIFEDKKSGTQTLQTTAPLVLEVLPIDISGLKNYHDIKDIIEVTPNESSNIYMIIGSILLANIIVILIFCFIKKRKKKTIRLKPFSNVSAFDEAMKALAKVASENILPTKIFYSRLDYIYRTYFDAQLNIHSLQSTSDEMMIRLQVSLQQNELRTHFFQLVRLIDAAKFAQYIPSEDYKNEAINIILTTIEFIHLQKQQAI